MQVYLPDAMYKQVKARGLPVSELLQQAVKAELRRQDLLAETDRYLARLVAEVGAPGIHDHGRTLTAETRRRRGHTRKRGRAIEIPRGRAAGRALRATCPVSP